MLNITKDAFESLSRVVEKLTEDTPSSLSSGFSQMDKQSNSACRASCPMEGKVLPDNMRPAVSSFGDDSGEEEFDESIFYARRGSQEEIRQVKIAAAKELAADGDFPT